MKCCLSVLQGKKEMPTDTLETQHITLVAKPHDGKVTISAEIPVTGNAEEYVVTIDIAPPAHTAQPTKLTLDDLYGALADTPLPEIAEHPLPEQRDLL